MSLFLFTHTSFLPVADITFNMGDNFRVSVFFFVFVFSGVSVIVIPTSAQ